MKRYINIVILYYGMMIFLFCGIACAADPGVNHKTNAPILFLPQPNYVFSRVVEGTEILHDFVVLNKGNSTLKIKKIKPG